VGDLQHYEVCGTPLLDVTHSLRVAASFATNDAVKGHNPTLYVLVVPALSGSVSASSDQGLQTIRLSSICLQMRAGLTFKKDIFLLNILKWPPSTIRHFTKRQRSISQEGYWPISPNAFRLLVVAFSGNGQRCNLSKQW
jgi:hypothetical protein